MTNYEKAVQIYEQSGQYAVYRACENGTLDHDAWLECQPCETVTPFSEGTCLVCGTDIDTSRRYYGLDRIFGSIRV